MATLFTNAPVPSPQPLTEVLQSQPDLSPSQKLSERLRGTVIIHGDIVNRDPELWDCERE